MSEQDRSIITTAWSAPRDINTWSGTSCKIVEALETQDVNVISITTELGKYRGKLARLIHRMFGLGTDYLGGPIYKNQRTRILTKKLKNIDCHKILHMGQSDLPSVKLPGIQHYLVLDTTSDTWHRYNTQLGSRNTDRGRKWHERLEFESFRHVEHFFSLSEYVKDSLINYYQVDSSRITVVGSGINNIQPFYGQKDYRNGHILFVAWGRFKDKGGLLLLEGFKIARKKLPWLKLFIVGQNDFQYHDRLTENVIVKGDTRGKELQELFNRAALFAMPSLFDPWGIVYTEALACKTPVLGLNRNALPEITQRGNYGFLVDKPTPQAVADRLINAFSQPERLQAMGKEGQSYCLSKYTWQNVARKISEKVF